MNDDKGDELIRRMEEFRDTLRAGIPIEAVHVSRRTTPDGYVTTRRHVVLNAPETPIGEGE